MDHKQIIAESIAKAKEILGKSGKDLLPYIEYEFGQFAETAEYLARLKLGDYISDEELKRRLAIQRTAMANVLLTMEGIGLVTAQNVVNAVLGVVYKAIRLSLGVVLPV